MVIKEENEITVRVIGSEKELISRLKEEGFCKGKSFTLDDYYLIPNNLDTNTLSIREILSKAVIVRYIIDNGDVIQKITFKIKDINEDGEIISQRAINCSVLDINEAKKLLKAMGYSEIMNIKEKDVVYYKNNFELAIKFIENSNTLIEIETNSEFNTIEKLKDKIKEMKLPIETNTYFVKKAEEELSKILKR